MNKTITALLVGIGVTIIPTLAFAHPGHGSEALQSTPLHWIEPVHAVVPIVLAAIACWLWRNRHNHS